jgi:hypothetical protein
LRRVFLRSLATFGIEISVVNYYRIESRARSASDELPSLLAVTTAPARQERANLDLIGVISLL